MAKIPCEHDQSSDIANYIGGGIRYKYFHKDIAGTFTAGQTYEFSLSEFGLDVTPKGFAWLLIVGDGALDHTSRPALFRGKIRYAPSVTNTDHCEFNGIVFY